MTDAKKSDKPAEEQKPKRKIGYYLVVVTDDAPQIISCDTREAFEDAVRQHVLGATSTLYAFGFLGERINITAPSPMCSIKIGDEVVKFGDASPQFEETGKIVPLVRRESDDA